MKRLSGVVVSMLCLAGVWAGRAAAACQIKSFAELPVTVIHNRFLIDAAIDGKPVKLIFDSGAFGTTLFGDAADMLGLGFRDNGDYAITGIGGEARERVRHVGTLTIGRYTRSKALLVVAPTARGDNGAAGLLGRDEYGNFDLEFDIPDRVIRFLRADGCSDAQMPYWATKSYSETPLVVLPEDVSAEFRIMLTLNGRSIEATVDSGSPITTVSTSAANNAGLFQRDFKAHGEVRGIGTHTLPGYTANFKTVAIDGETIQNVDLDVADLFHYSPVQKTGTLVATENTELSQGLLGADFLMSHRVLLSHSHRMMYFTYEGGLVFGPHAGPKGAGTKADAASSGPPPP
jgi:predicted aspartyl protease